MKWKAIGQSVIGLLHTQIGKGCEDVILYDIVNTDEEDILICCASDGAGSSKYASFASEFAVTKSKEILSGYAKVNADISEREIFTMVDDIFEGLSLIAKQDNEELNEYSCTLLGCYITETKAICFHIGDGAIVRDNGLDYYTAVWWPQNGEYQNTTSFIIDDPYLSNLKIMVLEEEINEIALFTDGLQMLALNMEGHCVHQPFFNDMFKYLRQANAPDKVEILNSKLADYLSSETINSRTDDDKTLFIASRIYNEHINSIVSTPSE